MSNTHIRATVAAIAALAVVTPTITHVPLAPVSSMAVAHAAPSKLSSSNNIRISGITGTDSRDGHKVQPSDPYLWGGTAVIDFSLSGQNAKKGQVLDFTLQAQDPGQERAAAWSKGFRGTQKISQNGETIATMTFSDKTYHLSFVKDVAAFDIPMSAQIYADPTFDEYQDSTLRFFFGSDSSGTEIAHADFKLRSGKRLPENLGINHYGADVDATTGFVRIIRGLVLPANTNMQAKAVRMKLTIPEDSKESRFWQECGTTVCKWATDKDKGWDVKYVDRDSQPYNWNNRVPAGTYGTDYTITHVPGTNTWEFWFPHVPAHMSPTVYGYWIAPYEGKADYQMEWEWGYAPENTPRADIDFVNRVETEKNGAKTTDPEAVEKAGLSPSARHEYVRHAYINNIPGLEHGNGKVLDGPLASSRHNFSYKNTTVMRGIDSAVQLWLSEQGDQAVPEGSSFTKLEGVTPWVTIDPTKGWLYIKPDKSVKPGDYKMKFLLTYDDSSKQTLPVTITVKDVASTVNPAYSDNTTVTQNTTETIAVPGGLGGTKVSSFKAGKGIPAWAKVSPTGEITVAPGWNINPGTYSVPVDITYAQDGSKDSIKAKVTVTKGADAAHYSIAYRNISARQGENSATKPSTAMPRGAAITTVDKSWVHIDDATKGALTVNPDFDTNGTVPVTVTIRYADGSTENTTFNVTVKPGKDNRAHTPVYAQSNSVRQGEKVTVPEPADKGNATFKLDTSATNPSWVTVAPGGSITAHPATTVKPGTYHVHVLATYRDKTTNSSDVTITVTSASDAVLRNPTYAKSSTAQGVPATVAAPSDASGARFSALSTPPWVTVNADGSLRVNPGFDITPATYTAIIRATFSDGSTKDIPARITVTKGKSSKAYTPVYTLGTQVNQKGHALIPAPNEAHGASFTGVDVPEWATVLRDGSIRVSPGLDAPTGDTTMTIKATWPDSSSKTIPATVTVVKAGDDLSYTLAYDPVTIKEGTTATVGAPGAVPEGTTFVLEQAPGFVTLDASTGAMTLAPGFDEVVGVTPVVVDANFPDGTSRTLKMPVTVTAATDAEHYDNEDSHPASVLTGAQGEHVHHDGPRTLPAGARCELVTGMDIMTVDPTTCAIDVDIPKDHAPGDVDYSIVTIYPDGTKNTTTGTLTVTEGDPTELYPVTYTPDEDHPATVTPGKDATIPAPDNGDTSGATFAPGEGNPDWITVNPDGSLTLAPGTDIAPGTYKAIVTATYPNGTTVTKMIPVVVGTAADNVTTPFGSENSPITGDTTTGFTGAPQGSTFSVKGADGANLPDWVHVDPATGVITVTPPPGTDASTLNGVITLTYPDGTTDTRTVAIKVPETPATDDGLSSGINGTLNINGDSGSSEFAPVVLVLGIVGIIATLVNSLAHAKLPGLPPLPTIPGLPNLFPAPPAPAPAPCPDPRDHVAVDNVNRDKLEHNDHNLCVKTDTNAASIR